MISAISWLGNSYVFFSIEYPGLQLLDQIGQLQISGLDILQSPLALILILFHYYFIDSIIHESRTRLVFPEELKAEIIVDDLQHLALKVLQLVDSQGVVLDQITDEADFLGGYRIIIAIHFSKKKIIFGGYLN